MGWRAAPLTLLGVLASTAATRAARRLEEGPPAPPLPPYPSVAYVFRSRSLFLLSAIVEPSEHKRGGSEQVRGECDAAERQQADY